MPILSVAEKRILSDPAPWILLAISATALFITPADFFAAHSSLHSGYETVTQLFPFSKIEAHANYTGLGDATRVQLLFLWGLAPLSWVSSYLRFRDIEPSQVLYPHAVSFFRTLKPLILLMVFIAAVILALTEFYIPKEPGYCRGCVTHISVWSAVLRWGIIWAVGILLGFLQVVRKC